METEQISLLMQMVSQHDISELEIIKGDETVRISRFSKQQSSENLVPIIEAAPELVPIPQVTQETQNVVNKILHQIISPMVGVFYRASAPNEKNFIEVGQEIKEGDPICIIEAMKMLNQIRSDKAGIVKEILIENGQSVEYDQPIIVIE